MSFVVNIHNNTHKKTQNPRYDLLFNTNISNSKNRFRVPLAGSRKSLDCEKCITNTKIIKDNVLSEECKKVCYKGNSKIKRSTGGIITNSKFRFSHLEVLERNNKSFQQNSKLFNILRTTNINNGGIQCGNSTIDKKKKHISSKSRTMSIKNDTILYSQCVSCPTRDNTGKVIYPIKEVSCKNPSRLNGKLQSCHISTNDTELIHNKSTMPNIQYTNNSTNKLQERSAVINKNNNLSLETLQQETIYHNPMDKKQIHHFKTVPYEFGLQYVIRDNNIFLSWNKYTNPNFISYNVFSNDVVKIKIQDNEKVDYVLPYEYIYYNVYLQINFSNDGNLDSLNSETMQIYKKISIDVREINSVNNGINLNFTLGAIEFGELKYYKKFLNTDNWTIIKDTERIDYFDGTNFSITMKNLLPNTKYIFKIDTYREKQLVFSKIIEPEKDLLTNLSLGGFANIYNLVDLPKNYSVQFSISNNINDTLLLSLQNSPKLSETFCLKAKFENNTFVVSLKTFDTILTFVSLNVKNKLQTENLMDIELCADSFIVLLNDEKIIDAVVPFNDRISSKDIYIYISNNSSIKHLFLKEYILPVDKTAPTIPNNVQIKQIQNKIEISWYFSKDIDAKQYNIYKNNSLLYTVFHSNTGYATIFDNEIIVGEKYKYGIEAEDFDKNKSPLVEQIVDIIDKTIIGIEIFSINPLDNKLTLSWEPNNNNNYIKQYNVLKQIKETWIQVAIIPKDEQRFFNYIDTDVLNGNSYSYMIEVENDFGFKSTQNQVKTEIPYKKPEIYNLNAKAGETQICLSWNKSSSGIFQAYVIDKTPIDPSSLISFPLLIDNIDIINFVDYGLHPNEIYNYRIREYTIFSSYSDEKTLSARTNSDETNKFIFYNEIKNNLLVSSKNSLQLNWYSDTIINFSYYLVYINDGTSIKLLEKNIGENTFVFNDPIVGRNYNIQVLEYNTLNQITESYYFNGYLIDEPPNKVKNMKAIGNEKSISLFWDKNIEYDINKYILYKNNNKLIELGKNTTSYIDYNVTLGLKYIYKIVVYDIRGNESQPSMVESISELVPGDPQIPNNFKANNFKKKLSLLWDNNIDLDFDYYRIFKNGSHIDTIYKENTRYYRVINVPYENQKYSSLKNGGESGIDKSNTLFWKSHLEDDGWISDINKGISINKGSDIYINSHWIQLKLEENVPVLGVIFKNISNTIYLKKMAIKTSLYDNNWHNENWVELTNDTSLYTANGPSKTNTKLFFKKNHMAKYIRIYIMEYNDNAGIKVSLLYDCKPTNTIIYNDYNVRMGETYQYKISSIDLYNRETITNTIEAEPKDPYPGAPSEPKNVQLKNVKKFITISWDKNPEPDVLYYKIYKKLDDAQLFDFFTISDNSDNLQIIDDDGVVKYIYTDVNVVRDKKYNYKIAAVDTDMNESNFVLKTFTNIDQPPQRVSDFTIEAENNRIKLLWKKSKEADIINYKIYRSENDRTSYNNIYNIVHAYNDDTNQIYYDTNVMNDKKYYYTITAVDTSNNESSINYSSPLFAIPRNFPPEKPNIKRIISENNYLTIELDEIIVYNDILEYKLYRKINEGPFTLVKTFLSNDFKNKIIVYNDLNLVNGEKYSYYVAVFNKYNLSTLSDNKNGIPLDNSPPPPVSTIRVDNFYNKIKINWTVIPNKQISRFDVYRDDIFLSSVFDDTTYLDKMAQPNKTYDYMIKVVNKKLLESTNNPSASGKLYISLFPIVVINEIFFDRIRLNISTTTLKPTISSSPFDIPIKPNTQNDNLRIDGDILSYKIYYKNTQDIQYTNLISTDKDVEIKNLKNNMNYRFFVELIYNNVVSEKSIDIQFITPKQPSLTLQEINNLDFVLFPNSIQINWALQQEIWDLQNYMLSVDIDISDNKITKSYTLDNNAINYTIRDFYSNVSYTVSLKYSTLSGQESPVKTISFKTNKSNEQKLYDTYLSLVLSIEKQKYTTVDAYERDIATLQNIPSKVGLQHHITRVLTRLINEKNNLENKIDTEKKITEINQSILKNNFDDLTVIKNSLVNFKPFIDLTFKYEIAKNNLNSILQQKTSFIKTNENIASIDKAIQENNLEIIIQLEQQLTAFIPNELLRNIYMNKYSIMLNALNDLRVDAGNRTDTLNYIKKIGTILNSKKFIEIETLFLELRSFSPHPELKEEFDIIFLEISKLRNTISANDRKEYDWFSSGIKNKIIHIGSKKTIQWDNADFDGMTLTLVKRNGNFFFNWVLLDQYLDRTSFLYLSMMEKNKLVNIELFSQELTVDIIRKKNDIYNMVYNNVVVKLVKNKYYDFLGSIVVDNSIKLEDNDLIVKGTKWMLKDDIFINIYNFKNTTTNNYFKDISFGNMYYSMSTDMTKKSNLNVEFYKNVESYIAVIDDVKKYVSLKKSTLVYPDNHLKNIEFRGISFFVNNWKSANLIKIKETYVKRNSLIDSETIHKFTDENGTNLSTLDLDNLINIYNKSEWVFVYIELTNTLTELNKNDVIFGSFDGNVSISNVIFYKKPVSINNLRYIANADPITYDIKIEQKVYSTVFTNSFSFENSVDEKNIIISKQKNEFGTKPIYKSFYKKSNTVWEEGIFNYLSQKIVFNDIFIKNGFDNLLDAKMYAVKVPSCYGIMKSEKLYWLMERKLRLTLENKTFGWLLKSNIRSYNGWYRLYEILKSFDINVQLQLPDSSLYSRLANNKLLKENLSYIRFDENSEFTKILTDNDIKEKTTTNVLISNPGSNIVGGGNDANIDYWIPELNEISKQVCFYSIDYNINGIQNKIIILFYNTFINQLFLNHEILTEFLN